MPNRLAREPSAYLRQHQSNPVDWLPWGVEALERARTLNRPILLSIGYSACHWCHVMARESFSDHDTAALMNACFVNVKVDREERPDIDAIYIRALQKMGRRPGWPLTMFLTPDAKPFWGGTYFPRDECDGLPAFRDVLRYVNDAYRSAPEASARKGRELVTELLGASRKGRAPTQTSPNRAADELLAQVDKKCGGLRGERKFPHPPLFRFLWNQGLRANRLDFQEAVALTLDKMALGGLFDHVGGGFFRYSVDDRWEIPHFEKMLYDNALLISLCSEVYRTRGRMLYRDIVKRTVHWLFREMLTAGGAFACSLDAESGGQEGGYYLITGDDIAGALGPSADNFRMRYFDRSPDFMGAKILNRSCETPADAENSDFLQRCDRLLVGRTRRSPPRCDDKILADWNGLAIASLVEASAAFDEPHWMAAAERAFEFIAVRLAPDGILHHSWNRGQIGAAAILDDYANMSLAAIKLFEATGSSQYRERAIRWGDHCLTHFADPQGGFFYTPDTAEHLVARIRDGEDTVTPSGNGMMARVLSELYLLTGDDRYERSVRSLFDAFAGEIEEGSFVFSSILDAQQFRTRVAQVTIIGDRADPSTEILWRIARSGSPVDRMIRIVGTNEESLSRHPAVGGGGRNNPVAYVCVGATCSLPLSNPNDLMQALKDAHESRSC